MSRSTRAAKGFATAIVQYFCQILVQILLAPLVLKVAGRETLGAYAAITQTLGLLALVDVAGAWSLERFLGQAVGAEDNGERFRAVFTTARTLLIITNVTFAILVVIFSFFIGSLFHLSPHIDFQARGALYVIAVWSVVRTPLAAYRDASVATQDLAAVNIISAFSGIGRAVGSLLAVVAGSGLFGLMLAGTVVEAFATVYYRVRFRRLNPGLTPKWGLPDKALMREMLGFQGYAAFLNIGNRLFFNSANMLAGITSGAAAASTFYTTQMPAMTGFNMIYKLAENSAPAIYELHGREEHQRLRNAFIRLLRLLLFMTIPLAVGIFLFNRDLVVTWVGQKQYAGQLMTVTIGIYCIVKATQGLAILFSFVFGWVRLLAVTSLLQGIANFGLGYYLGKLFGLGGITLAMVLVLSPQLIILIRKLNSALELQFPRVLLGIFLRLVFPLAAACVVSLVVHHFVHPAYRHFLPFAAEFLAFSLVYLPLCYRFSLNGQDRKDTDRYLAAFAGKFKLLQSRS